MHGVMGERGRAHQHTARTWLSASAVAPRASSQRTALRLPLVAAVCKGLTQFIKSTVVIDRRVVVRRSKDTELAVCGAQVQKVMEQIEKATAEAK